MRRKKLQRRSRFWRLPVATLVIALVVSAFGVTAGAATTTPLTSVTLKQLHVSFKAQQAALQQRQELELARLQQYWAEDLEVIQRGGEAEQAAIAQALAAAIAPLTAIQSEVEARRAAELDAVQGTKARERQDAQASLRDRATSIPAGATPLAEAQAKPIVAELQKKLDANLVAVDAQTRSDVAALQSQSDALESQRKAERSALANAQSVDVTDLQNAYDGRVAETKLRLTERVAELDAEQGVLDTNYKSSFDATKVQNAAEYRSAKAEGATDEALKALQATQQSRLDMLTSAYASASKAMKSERALASASSGDDLGTLKSQFDAQISARRSTASLVLKQYDTRTAYLLLSAQQAVPARQVEGSDKIESLRAWLAVDVATQTRDAKKLATAGSALLAILDRQFAESAKRMTSKFDQQRDQAARVVDADIAVASAPFTAMQTEAANGLAADLKRSQENANEAAAALRRRHEMELVLASTDYQIMRARVASYLDSDAAAYTPLENFYDPATDFGSLFNIARSLRIHDRTPTGEGVKIALIDTGVVDVDGLAHSDITIGPDFTIEDANPETRGHDTNGHGTHLAGIIVGRDAAWAAGDRDRTPDRFVGIAPDAELISLKAGSADGAADPSQVIAAINWVLRYNQEHLEDPIRVINLAYGTDSEQDYTVDPLAYAVERAWHAGVVVVVAAGNDGWDAAHLSNPAIDPFVIAVGASEGTSAHAVPASYSSQGTSDRTADLIAPGRSVVSLRVPGSWTDQFNMGGRAGGTLVRGSGTSQATAVVTGAVADLLSQRPELSPDQVKAALIDAATGAKKSDPLVQGAGVLDLGKALLSKTVDVPQDFDRATGTGSLEAARGSSHLVHDDGTLLVGEQDLFGNDFGADSWATDAWSGSRWRESSWSADNWAGSRWRDFGWTSELWSGSRWRDSAWSGSRWRDSSWSGSRWRDADWAGSRWRGFGDF